MEMKFCDYKDLFKKIKVKHEGASACSMIKDEFVFTDIIPFDICPYLFIASIPYLNVIRSKGAFPFKKEPHGIPVQCSHPKGVCVEINEEFQQSRAISHIRVVGAKEVCPFGHKKGETYMFDLSNLPFCIYSIAPLYTAAFRLIAESEGGKKKTDALSVRCSLSECDSIFTVELK